MEKAISDTRETRVQTAFRFSPALLRRVKHSAREMHMSLNSYVEHVLQRATLSKPAFPALPKEFKVSEEIRSLSRGLKMDPRYIGKDTQEQIRLDDLAKYEYLSEKLGVK